MPYQKNLLFPVLLSFLLTLLLRCSEPSLPAEQQILNNFEEAKTAVEQLNSQKLREILADDFEIIGARQPYDYELIKKTMALFRFRKQKVNIIFSSTTVTLDKYNTQLAALESTALITGGRGLIPEDGRLYKVKSQWRLYDEQWKITKLSWE